MVTSSPDSTRAPMPRRATSGLKLLHLSSRSCDRSRFGAGRAAFATSDGHAATVLLLTRLVMNGVVSSRSRSATQRMCPPLRLHTVDAVRHKVVLRSSAVHQNCSPPYIHVRCRRYCKAIVSSPLTFTLKRSTRWGVAIKHWSSTGT